MRATHCVVAKLKQQFRGSDSPCWSQFALECPSGKFAKGRTTSSDAQQYLITPLENAYASSDGPVSINHVCPCTHVWVASTGFCVRDLSVVQYRSHNKDLHSPKSACHESANQSGLQASAGMSGSVKSFSLMKRAA